MKKSKIGSSLAKKISLIVLVMVVFSTAIVGIFSYFLYRNGTIALSADKALAIAQSVAASINPSDFKEILATNTKTQHWYDMKSCVDIIKSTTDVQYLYVLDKDYGENVKYFVEGTYNGEEAVDLGEEESADYYADEMFESLKTGQTSTTDIYSADEYGMMVSGFCPIFDDDNSTVIGIVGVDLGIDEVTKASDVFGIQIIVLVIIFSAMFWLISRWYIKWSIGKPISALTAASKKFAEGDMEIELSIRSNDEIGELTASFQNMADCTKTQIEILEGLASGDLTAEISPRSNRDSMSFAMKKMIDNLNNMFAEVSSSTVHVSTGADQIANASQRLAQGASEQAATVEQLEGFIVQMSEKTKENVVKAGKAATLANTVKNNADKGSRQMDRMMQAVNEINEASQSINKVIKVIDDIAFQTNILALNAAVEAARAGQHGKGFAVVADEVRSLAGKSAEAAKDTSALISNSMEKAELGAQIAGETAASLTEIVSGINESSKIISEIASFSEDQGISIAKINDDIGIVSQIVQQNSATAEESAASSEELDSQATLLQESISRFKLKTINNVADRNTATLGTSRNTTLSHSAISLDDRLGKY